MVFKQRTAWLLPILLLSVNIAHADVWEDLILAAKAGQRQNIAGQYVRQTANGVSAFTVYRLRQNGTVIERRIAADGIPRELIKTRNSVRFYTINPQGLLLAKMDSIRFFPAVLPLDTQVLKNSYIASEGQEGRIADKDCRWVWLAPLDNNRYTQGFCLDNSNRLPLIQVYKDGRRISETNSFIRVSSEHPAENNIKPDGRLTVKDALQLPPELNRAHLNNTQIHDAYIGDLPTGFFILSRHNIATPSGGVGRHYVIGDGLVNVSLFVEPMDSFAAETSSRTGTVSGALSMAVLISGRFKITAVGDLPPKGLSNLLQNIRVK